MRRKEKEEIGILLTREILAMLQDEELSKEQRLDVLNSVLFGTEAPGLLGAMSRMLQAGFDKVNGDRTRRIEKERERKRNAARNSAEWRGIARNGEIKYNKVNINPYNPPKGDEKENEDVCESETREAGESEGGATAAEVESAARRLAEAVEATEAFAHMRTSRKALERSLVKVLKKRCAATTGDAVAFRMSAAGLGREIVSGLEAWTAGWAAQGWQYAPGKVTKWLADEKWLEAPRPGASSSAEAATPGDIGVDELV